MAFDVQTLEEQLTATNDVIQWFPERAFDFTHEGVKTFTLVMEQDTGHVGGKVWDAETVLSHYLHDIVGVTLQNKRVIELGAGTGLAGIVSSHLGALVCATELSEALPLLERNCVKNGPESSPILVRELAWGEPMHPDISSMAPFDVILVADCVYWPESYAPLADSIVACCGEQTTVFISYEQRRKDVSPFFVHLQNIPGIVVEEDKDLESDSTATSKGAELGNVHIRRLELRRVPSEPTPVIVADEFRQTEE